MTATSFAEIQWDLSPQGSPEWLAARRGMLTGSNFWLSRDRLADKPAKAAKVDNKTGEVLEQARDAVRGDYSAQAKRHAKDKARERCGGCAPDSFQNGAMKFGSEQEAYARAAYEARTGYIVDEVGFAYTPDRKFGCSVDGLIGKDGIVEIKTMVSSDTLFTAVVDGDISAYRDQCLGAMWLLGRQWVDLVLWAPDMPEEMRLTVVRIERNDDDIEALEQDLVAFDCLITEYENAMRARMASVALA